MLACSHTRSFAQLGALARRLDARLGTEILPWPEEDVGRDTQDEREGVECEVVDLVSGNVADVSGITSACV